MNIGVLSGKGGWHLRDLQRAAAALDLRVVPLDFRDLSAAAGEAGEGLSAGAVELAGLDRLLVRAMPGGSLEQVIFRMDVLQRLAAAGVPVVNPPSAIECAVDKYLALARLRAAGLPVPQTRVSQRACRALEDFEALGRDVVVKPIFGSEGKGMMRISDADLAWRSFHALERQGAAIYLQRFIPHPGWDLRVFVLGGGTPGARVLAAMRRSIPGPADAHPSPGGIPGEWRTNIARGGRGEPVDLPEEAAGLALRAAAACGTEIAGVDLLPDAAGRLLILEVNSAPGWEALSSVASIDIAREVLLYLQQRA